MQSWLKWRGRDGTLQGMRVARPGPDLFGTPDLPDGLSYDAEFLTPGEEATLLAAFAGLPFREAIFRQYTARRRVVRFGRTFDPARREWVDGEPLPTWLAGARRKAAARCSVDENAFVHALVTEYRPGTPIGWHRDKPEYGIVVGISLGNACRMRFRPYDRKKERGVVIALELAPRSIYVMQDEIRWRWQHSIPPAKALRYSITFRTRA